MEITVYADVLLVVNFLIDYLLLLFCARLSGRRIIRKRLLAGALVGALTSLVIFLPPLSFWPMTLLKAGIAVLMVRLAYPWLSWRVFFRDSFLFFTVSFLLPGSVWDCGWGLELPACSAITASPILMSAWARCSSR